MWRRLQVKKPSPATGARGHAGSSLVAIQHAEALRAGRAGAEVCEGAGRPPSAQDDRAVEEGRSLRGYQPVRPGAQDAAVARPFHVEDERAAPPVEPGRRRGIGFSTAVGSNGAKNGERAQGRGARDRPGNAPASSRLATLIARSASPRWFVSELTARASPRLYRGPGEPRSRASASTCGVCGNRSKPSTPSSGSRARRARRGRARASPDRTRDRRCAAGRSAASRSATPRREAGARRVEHDRVRRASAPRRDPSSASTRRVPRSRRPRSGARRGCGAGRRRPRRPTPPRSRDRSGARAAA